MAEPTPISIREAFAGKRVLLTGATGFVGKVWLAMLLDRLPEIGRVYVLSRPKALMSARERFEKILNQSPAFGPLHERLGPALGPLLASKLEVVEGEITEPGLGLAPEVHARLSQHLAGARAELLARQAERNGKWFDAEADRLDRWAADRHATLEAELRSLDEKHKALLRAAREAGSLPQKLALRQQARNLELKRHETWRVAEQAKGEIDSQREALLDTIADRLQQRTAATDLFTIRWTIA